jgi:hypothetical protein
MKSDSEDRVLGRQEIASWITRYRASGMSLAVFAHEHGIAPGRLRYWVYYKQRRSKDTPGPMFQELKLAAPLIENWAAEVSLAQGLSVRFSATAAPAWIGLVIEALQRTCSV